MERCRRAPVRSRLRRRVRCKRRTQREWTTAEHRQDDERNGTREPSTRRALASSLDHRGRRHRRLRRAGSSRETSRGRGLAGSSRARRVRHGEWARRQKNRECLSIPSARHARFPQPDSHDRCPRAAKRPPIRTGPRILRAAFLPIDRAVRAPRFRATGIGRRFRPRRVDCRADSESSILREGLGRLA